MLHETNEKGKVQVYNARISFEEVYKNINLSGDLLKNLKSADILLLPYEDINGIENCFPEQTKQFYFFLKKEAKKNNLSVDIGASDDEYKELELHADVINISEILIQWILFPIATNMISSYLLNIVRQRKKKMSTRVKISAVKEGKTKTIKYEGDIENFERAMKNIKENIFDE